MVAADNVVGSGDEGRGGGGGEEEKEGTEVSGVHGRGDG